MARYRRKAPKKLGGKMREVRLRLEITQEQVADYLETHSGAISRGNLVGLRTVEALLSEAVC